MYSEGALMPFLQFLLGIFLELVGSSGILDIESRVGSGEEGRYVAIWSLEGCNKCCDGCATDDAVNGSLDPGFSVLAKGGTSVSHQGRILFSLII